LGNYVTITILIISIALSTMEEDGRFAETYKGKEMAG
jgi:hypothetical protein